MTASYPMYSRPETAAAVARFWAAIRAALPTDRPIPDHLSDPKDLWQHWLSEDLLLSQTCGLPYRSGLHGNVSLVATPNYALPGCPPGHYNSVFLMRRDGAVARAEQWGNLRLAINSFDSQSGWGAPQNYMISNSYQPFHNIHVTGAHALSVEAVTTGTADIACIDAQTWRLIQRYSAPDLVELARTTPTPGLCFITALDQDPVPLRAALATAIAQLSDMDREALNLYDLVDIPAEAYLAIPTPAKPEATRPDLMHADAP